MDTLEHQLPHRADVEIFWNGNPVIVSFGPFERLVPAKSWLTVLDIVFCNHPPLSVEDVVGQSGRGEDEFVLGLVSLFPCEDGDTLIAPPDPNPDTLFDEMRKILKRTV